MLARSSDREGPSLLSNLKKTLKPLLESEFLMKLQGISRCIWSFFDKAERRMQSLRLLSLPFWLRWPLTFPWWPELQEISLGNPLQWKFMETINDKDHQAEMVTQKLPQYQLLLMLLPPASFKVHPESRQNDFSEGKWQRFPLRDSTLRLSLYHGSDYFCFHLDVLFFLFWVWTVLGLVLVSKDSMLWLFWSKTWRWKCCVDRHGVVTPAFLTPAHFAFAECLSPMKA